MKTLLINHTFASTDGQGMVNAQVARALLAADHEVTLVGCEVPEDISTHKRAQLVEMSPPNWVPTRLVRHAIFGQQTTNLICRLRPEYDIVVANGGMSFAPTDVNLCHFVHASWAESRHHSSQSPGRGGSLRSVYQHLYTKQACWWEKNAYRRAGRIIAVSQTIKDQLVQNVQIEANKIDVIESGISAINTPMSRNIARNSMAVSAHEFVVLFAGDLKTPRKNFDVILRALRHLPKGFRVVAAGEHKAGPYPEMAAEIGVEQQVTFLGMRPDLRSLYAGADAFVLMSHYEPFGLVVTEAMIAGIPVVTTAQVGAAPVVTRHNAGFVLDDPEDEATLARTLIHLRNKPRLAEALGLRGRGVAEDLAWDQVGLRYERLFTQVATEQAAVYRHKR